MAIFTVTITLIIPVIITAQLQHQLAGQHGIHLPLRAIHQLLHAILLLHVIYPHPHH
jgi:hypothetical protein